MKKLLLSSILAASLSLAGCNTVDLSTIIAQVQNSTVSLCGYVPTVETIVAIVGANDPTLVTGLQIADAICAAVKPKATPDVSSGAKVAGVVVKGHFVVK
jgi:hypothetical protein